MGIDEGINVSQITLGASFLTFYILALLVPIGVASCYAMLVMQRPGAVDKVAEQ